MVKEQFPNSPVSWQASFLSSQTGVNVGDEVTLLVTFAAVGAWLVGSGALVGLLVELEFATGVGLEVTNMLSVGSTAVGTPLPLNWVSPAVGPSVGASVDVFVGAVVSFGPAVGASVGSFSPSSYTPSATVEPSVCKIPLSNCWIKASENAVCSPDAKSSVKSLEELMIGTLVVTSTHKSDAGLPVGQSELNKAK